MRIDFIVNVIQISYDGDVYSYVSVTAIHSHVY